MSEAKKEVDLAGLARAAEPIAKPRRGWARIVLPGAVVAVFLFLLRDALVELVRPRIEVTVIRPTRIEGDGASGADSVAADVVAVQAAGWIEPDPFPVLVPALAGGIVAELLVQESDALAPGDPVARLVDDDARIARDFAIGALALAAGELEAAQARATIADERFKAAIEVTEALASARATHVGAVAEAELRDAAISEGEARVALAESEVIVQRELDAAGASGPRQVEIAEAELIVARATLARLRADSSSSHARTESASARLARAETEATLRFTDRLERDVAQASLAVAAAAVAQANAHLAEADLALARTTIVASTSGVVLERLVTQGEHVPVGGAVCSVWTPDSLRVRVDVPQGDVERLVVGQRAEIASDSRRGRPYHGEVIRLVQLADIQKVTLEAQVRVVDADEFLRPDMLVQVRFFGVRAASANGALETSAAAGLRIALPARLVEDGSVWLFDPVEHVARRVEVQVGAPFGTPAMVEVLSGVDLTDKVIDTGRDALARSGGDVNGVPVRVVERAATRVGGER